MPGQEAFAEVLSFADFAVRHTIAEPGCWREDPADVGGGHCEGGAGREVGFETGWLREDPVDGESDADALRSAPKPVLAPQKKAIRFPESPWIFITDSRD